MSWLNFNDSLSSIKGQLTNLASGVLAEGIVQNKDERDDSINPQEDETETSNLKAEKSSENGWFWKQTEEDKITHLVQRIEVLESEKKDLIVSLEQLDYDCQQTTDKLVTLKDNLRADYEELKAKYDKLANEQPETTNLTNKICTLNSQNEKLSSAYQTLKEEYEKFKIQQSDVSKSSEENERLRLENEKLSRELNEVRSSDARPEPLQVEETVAWSKLQEENEKLKTQLQETQKNSNLQSENDQLKVENQALKANLEEEKQKSTTHQEVVQKNCILQQENDRLKAGNHKLAEIEDTRNKDQESKVELLNSQKRQLEEELDMLKASLEKLQQNSTTMKLENDELKEDKQKLAQELHETRLDRQETPSLQDESLKALQEEHAKLKVAFQELLLNLEENEMLKSENSKLVQKVKTREAEVEKLATLNENYIKIISESVQNLTSDMEDYSFTAEDDGEFGQNFQALLKHVFELKSKIETLEKDLFQVKQEKNNSIIEKNYEIEKLLQNSEILSQEVIAKSRTIKDYEEECNELMKNNEALITELQGYKGSCGLQTISESNEDNLLLLESQLENANKRIQDLELTVSDFDTSKQETSLEVQTELDYIKKQLNLTGQELNRSKEQYRDLLTLYEKSQEDSFGLKLSLDKARLDYEITEYKLAETNVNLESMMEDNELGNKHLEKIEERERQLANEVEALQNLVDDLKHKVSLGEESNRGKETQIKNLVEKLQNSKICETELKLQVDTCSKELQILSEAKHTAEANYQQVSVKLRRFEEDQTTFNPAAVEVHDSDLQRKLEQTQEEKQTLETNFSALQKFTSELQQKINFLDNQRKEIVALITTKHEENIQYHNEIQRLNQLLAAESAKNNSNAYSDLILKNEEIAKLKDKNEFLNDKCAVLEKSLLEEQTNLQKARDEKQTILEREQSLSKELERLRVHLVDIEDTYTKDLLESEEQNKEMQNKLNEIVRREKDSSSIYTSVSIRANQQVETLQTQLQLVTNQRDELRIKVSNYEDVHNKQIAALTNLQLVLDQFQKDKEKDVTQETERIRRQINVEKSVQKDLKEEIAVLKAQLKESKQGLQAASRLADQLEKCKQQLTNYKELEKKMQEQVKRAEAKSEELTTQTDVKVDKTLIRNLILGYMGSNDGDKNQILKIIAKVLDFNQRECIQVNLSQQRSGWLESFLHPKVYSSDEEVNQESLSQAFVKFLENESKPKVLPNLLENQNSRKLSTDSNSSTARQSLLSEVVLPTFTDFGRSRNSGSILKDVLKDNS